MRIITSSAYKEAEIDEFILDYWGPEPDVKTAGTLWEGVKNFFGGSVGAIANTLYLIAKAPYMAMGTAFGLFPETIQGGGGSTKESVEEGFHVLSKWKELFLEAGRAIKGALQMGWGAGEKVVDVAEWVATKMVEAARSTDPQLVGPANDAAEQVKAKILDFGKQLPMAA